MSQGLSPSPGFPSQRVRDLASAADVCPGNCTHSYVEPGAHSLSLASPADSRCLCSVRPSPNIAKGKVAVSAQNSTEYPAPSVVVDGLPSVLPPTGTEDGDTESPNHSNEQQACTVLEVASSGLGPPGVGAGPWWYVDLGSVKNIDLVTVYVGTVWNNPATRANIDAVDMYQVRVGNVVPDANHTWDDPANQKCETSPELLAEGGTRVSYCNTVSGGRSGRYVFVGFEDGNSYASGDMMPPALCEVQVTEVRGAVSTGNGINVKDGAVRLSAANPEIPLTSRLGRVEVYEARGGEWGTVCVPASQQCATGTQDHLAVNLCQQMGFAGSDDGRVTRLFDQAGVGSGYDSIVAGNRDCQGGEVNIFACPFFSGETDTSGGCNPASTSAHRSDVGVECSGVYDVATDLANIGAGTLPISVAFVLTLSPPNS